MRFMILVKADQDTEAGVPPTEEALAAMASYNEELVKADVLQDAAGLQPSSKGARVAFTHGKASVTDWPIAETKELIGGYWIDSGLVQGRSDSLGVAHPLHAFPPDRADRGGGATADVRARGLRNG